MNLNVSPLNDFINIRGQNLEMKENIGETYHKTHFFSEWKVNTQNIISNFAVNATFVWEDSSSDLQISQTMTPPQIASDLYLFSKKIKNVRIFFCCSFFSSSFFLVSKDPAFFKNDHIVIVVSKRQVRWSEWKRSVDSSTFV